MNGRLLITTAAGLILTATAYAQSPSVTGSSSSQRNQTEMNSSSSSGQTQRAPTGSDTSARSNPSTSSGSAAGNTAGSISSGAGGTSQAQSSNPSSNTGEAQNNNRPASNQAQSNAPSANTPTNSQTQTNNPPTSNNQAQQAPSSRSNTNTAEQPNNRSNTAEQPNTRTNTAQEPNNSGSNTAQSSSANVGGSINLSEQQRTRVSQSFARLNVRPVTNVNFQVSVGTAVPRDIRLEPVPSEIVEVAPQFRGYSYFAVRDEIVIVEPSSEKIVAVLPRSGGSTAAAQPNESRAKVRFSDRDREMIRKHIHAQGRERRTVGSSETSSVRIGERLPDSVEIEAFPETVYREAPTLREYRYIERGPRTYIVEPQDRTVIEEVE